MSWRPPLCECGCRKQAVKHYRLDPRNLHERYALLAIGCGKRLGYTRIEYARAAVSGTKLPDRIRSTT